MVSCAQAEDGDPRGVERPPELLGSFFIGRGARHGETQKRPQHGHLRAMSRGGALGFELIERAFEQQHRPTPVVKRFRRLALRGLAREPFFRLGRIDAQRLRAAAALECVFALRIGNVMLKRREQKGAQLPARLLCGGERVFLDQRGEETLCKVFRVVR